MRETKSNGKVCSKAKQKKMFETSTKGMMLWVSELFDIWTKIETRFFMKSILFSKL